MGTPHCLETWLFQRVKVDEIAEIFLGDTSLPFGTPQGSNWPPPRANRQTKNCGRGEMLQGFVKNKGDQKLSPDDNTISNDDNVTKRSKTSSNFNGLKKQSFKPTWRASISTLL